MTHHATRPKFASLPKAKSGKLILLIHGLNGSAHGTWQKFLKCLSEDVDLQDVTLDCYEFPTSLIRWPFFGRRASIEQIASGLHTYLESMHADKDEVLLIGHSLGGLVARYYVLQRLKNNAHHHIKGLTLIATPNSGAALAKLATTFSWRHRHARQLCKNSDLLKSLNLQWLTYRVEAAIQTLYVVGGSDAVVTSESAEGYGNDTRIKTLIGHNHCSILDPNAQDDIRYKVVKDFVLETSLILPSTDEPERQIVVPFKSNKPDPREVLFEVYSPRVEPFYCERDVDATIHAATSTGHLWITGPSGVGKTTALKRAITQSDSTSEHVMLGSFQGASALSLIREIGNHLFEKIGQPEITIPADSTLPEVLKCFKTALRGMKTNGRLILFVEEIPIPLGSEYSAFLEMIYHLVLLSETDVVDYQIVWIFSSICDPRQYIARDKAKFLSKVFFIHMENWREDELRKLCEIIKNTLRYQLNSEQEKKVITAAQGSPRFIKALFRQRKQEVGAKLPFDSLIELVKNEFKND